MTATPWRDPCRPSARPLPRASVGPLPGPHQLRLRHRPQAAASSISWAGTCVATAASTPTQQAPVWWQAALHEGSTTAPAQQPANVVPRCLISSDAFRGQARRRRLGRASLASPIKKGGHVGSALNAFVRRSQRIGLLIVDLSTSCVPLWQPLLPIKGGPRRPGGGFGSFGQVALCS